jgi:hypothetical protein
MQEQLWVVLLVRHLPANDLLYKGAAHHRLDGWLLAGADEMLVNTVLHSSSSSTQTGCEHNDWHPGRLDSTAVTLTTAR